MAAQDVQETILYYYYYYYYYYYCPGTDKRRIWKKLENRVFHKNLFFQYFKWNWGGLGVSRVSAWTVRRRRHKFSRDLVLHDIRKCTFLKYWIFNVLEMVLKTFHFVPGLCRTPLLFIPRYLTNIFSKIFTRKRKTGIWVSKNPEFVSGSPPGGWFLFPEMIPPKKTSN